MSPSRAGSSHSSSWRIFSSVQLGSWPFSLQLGLKIDWKTSWNFNSQLKNYFLLFSIIKLTKLCIWIKLFTFKNTKVQIKLIEIKIKFRGHFYRKKVWRKYGSYKKSFCLKCTVSELWFFCLLTSKNLFSQKWMYAKKHKKRKIWLFTQFSSKIRKIYHICLKSG